MGTWAVHGTCPSRSSVTAHGRSSPSLTRMRDPNILCTCFYRNPSPLTMKVIREPTFLTSKENMFFTVVSRATQGQTLQKATRKLRPPCVVTNRLTTYHCRSNNHTGGVTSPLPVQRRIGQRGRCPSRYDGKTPHDQNQNAA